MKEMETRTTKMTVSKKGEPIFSESSTHIEIDDEAAGEYLKVSQLNGAVLIEKEEWPHIKEAIDKMFEQVRD